MPSAIPLRGIRMPDELYLKLRLIAKLQKRSFNQQAVFIFEEFVDDYEKQHGHLSVNTSDLYQ